MPEPQEPAEVTPQTEEEDEPDGGYRAAAISALVWCTLPMTLLIAWALFLSKGPKGACVDNSGQPCASPNVVAWDMLPSTAPVVAVATLLSVLVALLLRRFTTGWKSGTVGFASAVVGAGVVTVFWSAMGSS